MKPDSGRLGDVSTATGEGKRCAGRPSGIGIRGTGLVHSQLKG